MHNSDEDNTDSRLNEMKIHGEGFFTDFMSKPNIPIDIPEPYGKFAVKKFYDYGLHKWASPDYSVVGWSAKGRDGNKNIGEGNQKRVDALTSAEDQLSRFLMTGEFSDGPLTYDDDGTFYLTEASGGWMQRDLDKSYANAFDQNLAEMAFKVDPGSGRIGLFQDNAHPLFGDVYFGIDGKIDDAWDIGVDPGEEWTSWTHYARDIGGRFTEKPRLVAQANKRFTVDIGGSQGRDGQRVYNKDRAVKKQNQVNDIINFLNHPDNIDEVRRHIIDPDFIETDTMGSGSLYDPYEKGDKVIDYGGYVDIKRLAKQNPKFFEILDYEKRGFEHARKPWYLEGG